ncbi:CvpA family protein [Rhodanobacter sp. FDAARGOS 1247]|jgi:membrane protein required for colicin V production|uniref:CvpA family protein n=1 Tax=unclassified Rhodanobacter TaxID=2621553 RepID=UPI000700E621|nr:MULTISPECIES: CvpA family protein [unclassified Rhodanobacter]KQZ74661.1 colicin V production protein [Rhodanobacter sp. Root561]QRP65209.1 CvpA family protein [Rhodanobacter sp. FDAARGOS 1247]
MNWTDYIILGVLALSVLVGLWRGLVSEVLALVIWIAAFWVAWSFGPAVARHFEHVIELPSARIIVGYGLCFVAVLILGALLRFVISRLVESTGLSGTDRLLGMLFGLVRGVLLVTLLVFLIGFTAFTRDPWWQQSVLLPQFQHVAAWLGQQVPPGVRDYIHPPAVLDRLSGLPATLPASISGASPAPAATSIHPASPAAASSAAPPRNF